MHILYMDVCVYNYDYHRGNTRESPQLACYCITLIILTYVTVINVGFLHAWLAVVTFALYLSCVFCVLHVYVSVYMCVCVCVCVCMCVAGWV